MRGNEKVPKGSTQVSILLASPEVQSQLKQAYENAKKTSDDFREASQVNPESLHKPCSC